ncbi:TetR/AcrR family transcriptional regulator [Pseudonocardia ailaonensis]|uniref:TetR/AcrR family transcriptional regulator n=1 Tax=Pseudonocardia ailaonensis TaxID=367279 RepID=UPI0031DEBD97
MAKGSGSASADRSVATASSRELILDAARELIASRGYDGMVISDLCARSGLPASSIYYHFGNKLGVLAALLDRTFGELHAAFPDPTSYGPGDPLERFEAWFTAACRSLDQRPEYLRLLLAISVGSHKDTELVGDTVRRIRDYAHASWVSALTPIFGAEQAEFVDQLAVLGRAVTDGLAVTNSFDGMSYSSHVAPFVEMIRGLAERRGHGSSGGPQRSAK